MNSREIEKKIENDNYEIRTDFITEHQSTRLVQKILNRKKSE